MARYGQYNYSDEQLDRINVRRRESGRDELVNTKGIGGYSGRNEERAYDRYRKSIGSNDYMDRYQPEIEKHKGKTLNRKSESSNERESELDKYKSQKSLSERMAARGSLKDEIQNRSRASQVSRAVQSEDEKRRKKRKMGISTPSIQSSYTRFTA